MPDVLLTGPPRSGTTLSCELLNLVPETVALDEPMRVKTLVSDPAGEVERFLAATRASIVERGVAPSKQVAGRVLGSKIADRDGEAERTKLASRGEIDVGPQRGDFTLAIKHPGAFTAALPELVRRFRVCAIVRHPLAVLASWQTVPMRIRDGRIPGAERIAPELGAALDAIPDTVERHLHILRWCFDRYLTLLPRDAIVRYEDIIATGGAALAAAVPGAAALREPLASRNDPARYGKDVVERLRVRIADPGEPWWRLYDRQ